MALTYLKKSIDAGYIDYAHIQKDSDLDNIRNEKEFKEINAQLRNVGDYLFILRKAEKYNLSDNRPFPNFTYQSAENSNLATLRKSFNLDSIAGQGNDVLKILNLLHWIHNLIPHDGSHGNPVVKNAMSMIAECKRDNRGLNCRGLAMVLNECYLSLGIKSRIVTCLPKDSLKIDSDCHVINSVYSEKLKKWLWIDPTFNAYVMNEKGELLSIEEVREKIIRNEPLILNPHANWNNQNQQTKEYYLFTYMAKNLYMLECPVNSEYNMETKEEGRTYTYTTLIPLDYYEQTPDKTEDKDTKTNTTWIRYKTNNPTLFWQTP
ncbi:MAG: transglutaminase domain-containing protein [Bacteroidetes bacterium]|nr:transglutaminase domain-containing protein [Bacteroidota bacterium]